MIVIGIVGGIASGKSAVAAQFGSLGAVVIDADMVGHEVLEEADVIEAAIEYWGDDVVDANGALVRKEIAKRVFTQDMGGEGKPELEFWQHVTHPKIRQRVERQLNDLRKSNSPPPGVVLDAALLFEAGWDELCDAVIFLAVSEEIRLRRVLERGWTEAEFRSRESAQLSISEKRRKADYVIDNSVALDETYRRVKEIWIHLSS